jgi:hypothetical protein
MYIVFLDSNNMFYISKDEYDFLEIKLAPRIASLVHYVMEVTLKKFFEKLGNIKNPIKRLFLKNL